jgi:anhydro-N-acetylmuramic acid kinase
MKDKYRVVGVMSGTSLDGIDLAECELSFAEESGWIYKLGIAQTIPYPTEWKMQLRAAIDYSAERLQILNLDYTRFLGNIISEFIERNKFTKLDAVCSHGHTILHRPDKGITLQIGNLPEIVTCVGQKVVCDFRIQDVMLGGQGAPLVPIGDRLLFGEYDYCLNLGGFANVSYESVVGRIAYDICPVNIVLNHYALKLGVPFDDGGRIATRGDVNLSLLQSLNDLDFYQADPPKSLGLEWVQHEVFPVMEASGLMENDLIATFTEHIARQLAKQFKKESTILVTGGGAYNEHLVDRLKQHTGATVAIPSSKIIEYKEALVFALLGVLKLRDEVNCLSSVTGARHDHSSGVIHLMR